MLRTTTKAVKAKLNEHILSHFDESHGWESDDRLANLKDQLRSFDYMPTDYAKGIYMAEGGTFLVYYREQRDFLGDLLEETEFEREHKYSDDQVFKTYCHLIARQIAEMVRG